MVADSAGIRVVSYIRRPTAIPGWQFDSVPVVSIGTDFGEEPYLLSRVRGAFHHRNGFLLGDGGSGELRFFDEIGRHVRSVGGIGSGPGEFQAGFGGAIQWMGRIRGDSLIAWDLPLQRVTIFDPELNLVGTTPLRLPVVAYVVAGAFDDGDLLVWPFGIRMAPIPSPRVVVDTSFFAIVKRSDQASLDTIVRLPARPTYVEPDGVSVRVPFTADPAYAVGATVTWAGSGQSGEIARRGKDGTAHVIVRLPAGGAVPPAAVDAFRSAYLEGHTGAELAEQARVLNAIPLPAALPAFDLLHIDSEGNLWIREYLLPDAEEQQWLVLGDAGQPIARIETPSRLRVTSITRDLIVGIWRDALDVETVRVHRYTRR
jgi:hypothetical protein